VAFAEEPNESEESEEVMRYEEEEEQQQQISDQEFDQAQDSFANEEEDEVPTLIINTHQDIEDEEEDFAVLAVQNTGQYNSSMAAALTSIQAQEHKEHFTS